MESQTENDTVAVSKELLMLMWYLWYQPETGGFDATITTRRDFIERAALAINSATSIEHLIERAAVKLQTQFIKGSLGDKFNDFLLSVFSDDWRNRMRAGLNSEPPTPKP